MSIGKDWYRQLAAHRIGGEGTLRRNLLDFRDSSAPQSQSNYPSKRTIRGWEDETRSINLNSCKFLIAFCDHDLVHTKNFEPNYIQEFRLSLIRRHQKLENSGNRQQFGFLSNLISHGERNVTDLYQKYFGHYYCYSRMADGRIIRELLIFGPQRESYIISYVITYLGDVFYGYVIPSKLNINFIFLRPNTVSDISFRMLNIRYSNSENINKYSEMRGIWLRNSTEYFDPLASQVIIRKIKTIDEFDYSLYGNKIYNRFSSKSFTKEEDDIISENIGIIDDSDMEYSYIDGKLSEPLEYR